MKKRLFILLSSLCLTVASMLAAAQQWPQRTIRLAVSGAPGMPSDIAARILAQNLGAELGQTVVVENRPGAAGSIAARYVAMSEPDGYTMLLAPASTISIAPWTMAQEHKWDQELAPIGMFAYTPLAIAVKADSPVRSLQELVALGQKAKDSIVIANPGIYTMAHLTTGLLSEKTRTNFRAIPFNGFSGEMAAVLRGDAAAMIDGVTPILAQTRNNSLRILAVSSQEALPGLEQYPLFKEIMPGVLVDGWFGLFAPAKLDPALVERVNRGLNNIKRNPEMQAALGNLGMYTRQDTVKQFSDYVASQSEQWRNVVANMQPDPDQAAR